MSSRPEPDLQALGAFVKERRTWLGLTQTELGERVGWAQERVSVLERGKYGMPSLPTLETLAAALECPLAELVEAPGFALHAGNGTARTAPSPSGSALFYTLQQLLSLDVVGLPDALNATAELLVSALGAEKIDAFIRDPDTETLVAIGRSHTPLGQRQRALGLHRVPIANGGPIVAVFQTGIPFVTGHAEELTEMPRGVVAGLGVRSEMAVPLDVGPERRGVLSADSREPERFSQDDLRFLSTVARWVGTIAHRAELADLLSRQAAESARRLAAEEMITLLAHDLGNLLTPTKGHLDILCRRLAREQQSVNLADAEAAAAGLSRIRHLTTALLDVSRLEHGLFSLSLQPVDLALLVRETAGVLGPPASSIAVRAPEELIVEADPVRIEQVLHNVLANALNHAPADVPILIEVAETQQDDGACATVTIRDEGPGIPPELIPTLFTRFAKGSQSTGLGLGLHLARAIAEAHGGTLVVDSAPAAGTTVTLTLPAPGSPHAPPVTSSESLSVENDQRAAPHHL